ncbi:MAG: hypothetical protein ACXQTP_01815 [Candidatus Methanofastidiosia archaeon]
MAMITVARCKKCKKWFDEKELDDKNICESCKKKEEQKKEKQMLKDKDIKSHFLKYIERSGATSLQTLVKRYKIDIEEAKDALDTLEKEGKVIKRESKNKKGKFVYEFKKE